MNVPLDSSRKFLFSQPNSQTEWWYYSGHLSGERGQRFGFEVVFFSRRPKVEKILGVVPLRWISKRFAFAHFAISNTSDGSFAYSHRRTVWWGSHANASKFSVGLGKWSVEHNGDSHQLNVAMPDCSLELQLSPSKAAVLHGQAGHYLRNMNQQAFHLSYSRMKASGTLTQNGIQQTVSGNAWMDREFGVCNFDRDLLGWDWFAIQLDDNRELMLYRVFDENGNFNGHQILELIDTNGKVKEFKAADFKLQVLDSWTSNKTKTQYPNRWRLTIPELDISLSVKPMLPHQELDTRGSTSIIYWEGDCEVTGSESGKAISGNAFVELVGYNRSHQLLARPRIGIRSIIRATLNEGRFWLNYRRKTIRE
ncbi:MAG: lipocalin family protein [Pirellulaceae bacterium]